MVEEGESLIPALEDALEDEMMEVEDLLPETRYENALDDDINYLYSVDTEKYLTLENFPCSDEFCNTDTDFGISNIDATQNGQCLDSMLQDDNKDQSHHVIGDYPDYLLESGFGEKNCHLHFDQHSGYCLGNLSAEYPQTLEVDSDTDERLDLTTGISLRNEDTCDENDLSIANISIRDTFKGACGLGSSQWQVKHHILFGSSDLMTTDDTHNNLESRFLSEGKGDMLFLSTTSLSEISCGSLTNSLDQKTSVGESLKKNHADKDTVSANFLDAGKYRFLEFEGRDRALVTTKRMRKPTRRYIEESSAVKSRQCIEKSGFPYISHQNKILHTCYDIQWKSSGSMQQICSENSSTLSSSQVPYFVQPRRGRPRKNFTCTVKDLKGKKGHVQNAVEHKTTYGFVLSKSRNEENFLDSQTTRSDKCGARRKHHRLWSLAEVTKLIEGVSRYGVGRWTDIKRLLFSSSAYRTSVDLKDKWRNLLRASGAHIHGRKEFEARKKQHLPGLVPQSVLRRVRDLAIIHPYPRKRKTGAASLAAPPVDGKDTPCNNKRAVHRRYST